MISLPYKETKPHPLPIKPRPFTVPADLQRMSFSRVSSFLTRRVSLSIRRSYTPAAAAVEAAPEVYTKPPPQPREKKPGQLSTKQVNQYFDDGFLVVPQLFSPDELKPAIAAIEECVEQLADKLYKGGKIKDKAEGEDFYKRLIHIEAQFPGASIILHKLGTLPVGFQKLWSCDRLLNIIEQLIGPNIAGSPNWNLRPKTPDNEEATVPWHQDNAYFYEESLHTFIATAWIPLIDANKLNGCMQVVKGGHRLGKTATHTCCAGNTWFIDLAEEEMEKTLGVNMKTDVVTCEVPMGGVLFLNNCIPHRSLENYSNKVRWSLDLRWQDPSKPTGFEGIKDPVLMRTASDPNHTINWEKFAYEDRNEAQKQSLGIEEDEFDTTVHGQWMSRWPITNHNRHTEALRKATENT